MKIIKIHCKKEGAILSKEDLEKYVNNERLASIRASNNNTLSIYKIMETGTITPAPMNNHEYRGEIKFSESSIKCALDKLAIDTPIIKEHRDNTDEPVQEIGTIVGKFIKNNTLYAITHLNNKKDKYPSASIEADVILDNNNNVVDIVEISALALLENEEPAFSGAHYVQSIAAKKIEELKMQDITLNELQNIILQKKLHPSELFNIEQIQNDPRVASISKEYDKKIQELNTLNEKIEGEKRGFEEQLLKLQQDNNRNNMIKEISAKLDADPALEDSKRKYLMMQLKKGQFENPEEFYKKYHDEYDEIASIFTAQKNATASEDDENDTEINEMTDYDAIENVIKNE